MERAWTTRLYASSIAIVSGIYAMLSPATAMAGRQMTDGGAIGLGGAIMLAVGLVVLVHGIVLLTPMVARLRRVSGSLMVLWALIMLANQGLLATVPGWSMGEARMSSAATSGMGWDAGMVAIAVLMLASGLIMLRGGMSETGR